MPQHTLELGDNVLVRMSEIAMVSVQGCDLRIWLRGSARPEDFAHSSAEDARARYDFIRTAMGFAPREDAQG